MPEPGLTRDQDLDNGSIGKSNAQYGPGLRQVGAGPGSHLFEVTMALSKCLSLVGQGKIST